MADAMNIGMCGCTSPDGVPVVDGSLQTLIERIIKRSASPSIKSVFQGNWELTYAGDSKWQRALAHLGPRWRHFMQCDC